MALTDQQKQEALAELPGNLGFQVLLDILEEQQHATLARMAEAKTDAEVLRLARLWQAQFGYLNMMASQPQNMKQALEQQEEQFQAAMALDPGAPPFPPHRQQQLREIEELINKPRRRK